VHPVGKLCVGSKNDYHLFNGLDVLYHHAKFGEDVLRAPAVGAKIWCLFIFYLSVTLQVRCAVYLTVTYFEQVLCHGFGSILMLFSEMFQENSTAVLYSQEHRCVPV